MHIERQKGLKIVLHTILWLTVFSIWLYPLVIRSRPVGPYFGARIAIIVLLSYLNYFYLIPRLLLKKKTFIYLLICTLIVIGITLMIRLGVMVEPPQNNTRFLKNKSSISLGLIIVTFMVYSSPLIVSTVLRIYIEWRKNDKIKEEVEKEKINAELQFLKTQLKPHFLFNSLNAIYSLSVKNSPDTSTAIINLSELMRYMLYEADRDLVPLDRELDYLKSYVQLQRVRLSDSENVTLKISGDYQGKMIPPLLFISFIENAFKYGTDYEGRTFVKINLSIKDESLRLYVKNKIGSFKKISESSGIGLDNIKNRLELLYPDSHELTVKNNEKEYEVCLTLKFAR